MSKNHALTVLVFFSLAKLHGQSLGVTCYNNPSIYNPEFRNMSPTSDGGYIAHQGSGQTTKIIKLNSSFTPLWSYQTDNIFFSDNVETNDGNYVFLATDMSPASVHVFKFTPAGTLLWQKVYSTPGGFLSVDGIAPAAGADSGFVFFGGMSANVMWYMTKCDVNGNIQWQKEYAGIPGAGTIRSIITEPTGYVVGAWYGVNQVYSVAILKLDVSGNPMSGQSYSSNGSGGGIELFRHSLIKLASGNYFLWTHPQQTSGAINFTVSNSLSVVSCNAFSDSAGIFLDAVPTHNSADEVMMLFAYYNNLYGGFVMVSPSGTIGTQKYSSTGGIIPHRGNRLANGTTVLSGYVAAQNHYGSMIGVTDDFGNGICDPLDATYSAQLNYPYTSSALTLSSSTFNLVAAADTFTLIPIIYLPFNICGYLTGTNFETETSGLLSCFPNPSSGSTTVQLPQTMGLDGLTLQLFDCNGRCVDTRSNLISNEVKLQTEAGGFYLVVLSDQEGKTIARTRFVHAAE